MFGRGSVCRRVLRQYVGECGENEKSYGKEVLVVTSVCRRALLSHSRGGSTWWVCRQEELCERRSRSWDRSGRPWSKKPAYVVAMFGFRSGKKSPSYVVAMFGFAWIWRSFHDIGLSTLLTFSVLIQVVSLGAML